MDDSVSIFDCEPEAYKMYEVLKKLIEIDWCTGYELVSSQHDGLQDCMDRAREIIGKIENK